MGDLAMRMYLAMVLALVAVAATAPAQAQSRKPTAHEIAAIRDCAKKSEENVDGGEQKCLFKLVADPCMAPVGSASDNHMADCYQIEGAIWDALLNENYKGLLAALDDDQAAKARAMQRAWLAYRDTTCGFYYDKIHGTMAGFMEAACVARETARRALLLKFFTGL